MMQIVCISRGTLSGGKELAERLTSEYDQEYYLGIISERRAKVQYQQGTPGSPSPPGAAPESRMWTSTTGIPSIRSIG